MGPQWPCQATSVSGLRPTVTEPGRATRGGEGPQGCGAPGRGTAYLAKGPIVRIDLGVPFLDGRLPEFTASVVHRQLGGV